MLQPPEIRYSGTNIARKSAVMAKTSNRVQGDLSVEKCIDVLNKLWHEYEGTKRVKFCPLGGACTCFIETVDEMQENRVVRFLMGLNDDYAVVRFNIFAIKKVHGMDVVYAMVC